MVFSHYEVYLVELIAGKLKANGVDSIVLNTKDSAYNNFGMVELYVYKKDVIKAKFIIDQKEE